MTSLLITKRKLVKCSMNWCQCSKNISNNSIPVDELHPRIQKISQNFKDVSEDFIGKQINSLSTKSFR